MLLITCSCPITDQSILKSQPTRSFKATQLIYKLQKLQLRFELSLPTSVFKTLSKSKSTSSFLPIYINLFHYLLVFLSFASFASNILHFLLSEVCHTTTLNIFSHYFSQFKKRNNKEALHFILCLLFLKTPSALRRFSVSQCIHFHHTFNTYINNYIRKAITAHAPPTHNKQEIPFD